MLLLQSVIASKCSSAHVLFVSYVAHFDGSSILQSNRWLPIVSLFIDTETSLNTGGIFWQVYGEGAIEAAHSLKGCFYSLTARLCAFMSLLVCVCVFVCMICV